SSPSDRVGVPACGPFSSDQRQGEVERRALVLTALRPDAAAVELDELLADRQPEARASGAAGDRIIELLERLEQPRQIVLADPDTGVGDAQPGRVRLGHDADEHAALRGE